jgi:hypothetical protein
MLNVVMLSVTYAECHKQALYTKHHYAECRYAECHSTEGYGSPL